MPDRIPNFSPQRMATIPPWDPATEDLGIHEADPAPSPPFDGEGAGGEGFPPVPHDCIYGPWYDDHAKFFHIVDSEGYPCYWLNGVGSWLRVKNVAIQIELLLYALTNLEPRQRGQQ